MDITSTCTIVTYPGWWYTYPSEKYEFVSWDHSSQLNGKSYSKPPISNGEMPCHGYEMRFTRRYSDKDNDESHGPLRLMT